MSVLDILTNIPKDIECLCKESNLSEEQVLEQIKFLCDEVGINVIETEKGFYIPHYRVGK